MEFKKGDKINFKNYSGDYEFENKNTASGLIVEVISMNYKIIVDDAFLGGEFTFLKEEIKNCKII